MSVLYLQTATPDSYRGKYCGEGAGIKYAEEVNKVIERIHLEGKKVHINELLLWRDVDPIATGGMLYSRGISWLCWASAAA